ncbi:MAG: hypothetical protein DMG68_03640 [Acidobacteria bacterium]|nr:MAG: hypothetical protein DMG68_03640 [Acidobacteriota bacterium]
MTQLPSTFVSRVFEKTGSVLLSLHPDWRRIRRAGLIVSIGILLLLPVWIVRYPPLVDYPNHLARYFILAHLKDPNLHLAELYESKWGPYPYVALDLLGVALQRLMPIYVVGKVILSLCLVGVPIAAFFFLRQVSPEGRYLAAWTLVIAYGPLLMSGLMNDVLSEAICFWFLGVWLGYLRQPGAIRWWSLLALATLLYFTHLAGFAMAGLVVFTYSLLSRQSFGRLVTSLSLFVFAGMLHFLQSVSGAADYWGRSHLQYPGFGEKLASLTDPFRAYSRWDLLGVLLALVICVVISVWKNRDFHLRYPWIGVAGVVLLAFWLIPDMGEHYFDIRIVPYLFILTLCAANIGRRARVLGAIGLLVFVLRSVDVGYGFISQQPELQSLERSFVAIPAYSRVQPLEPIKGEFFRRPYLHFWAYGVIERGWFCPNLFHGKGLHPLAFRQFSPEPLRLNNGLRMNWPRTKHLQPCSADVQTDPDWQELTKYFDYLWVYDMPRFSAHASSIGTRVYSDNSISVFRLYGLPSSH